jgi:hypothetical protein
MQTLHFCFSVGALVSPFVVALTGCRTTYLAFALLSLPAGVATVWAGLQPLAKSLDAEESSAVASFGASSSSFANSGSFANSSFADASSASSYKRTATIGDEENSITKGDIEVEMVTTTRSSATPRGMLMIH